MQVADTRQLTPDFRREEIAQFITIIISSPDYITNPYLRSKLAEVLYHWLPNRQRWVHTRRTQWNYQQDGQDIFEHDSTVVQHLVRGTAACDEEVAVAWRGVGRAH